MMKFDKIIFVDADATARSVMAAAVMREEQLAPWGYVPTEGWVIPWE